MIAIVNELDDKILDQNVFIKGVNDQFKID